MSSAYVSGIVRDEGRRQSGHDTEETHGGDAPGRTMKRYGRKFRCSSFQVQSGNDKGADNSWCFNPADGGDAPGQAVRHPLIPVHSLPQPASRPLTPLFLPPWCALPSVGPAALMCWPTPSHNAATSQGTARKGAATWGPAQASFVKAGRRGGAIRLPTQSNGDERRVSAGRRCVNARPAGAVDGPAGRSWTQTAVELRLSSRS